MKKSNGLGKILSKIIIYIALFALAISIIVPVGWVFMASVKRNAEFIGADIDPWAFRFCFVPEVLKPISLLPIEPHLLSKCSLSLAFNCITGILCTGKI